MYPCDATIRKDVGLRLLRKVNKKPRISRMRETEAFFGVLVNCYNAGTGIPMACPLLFGWTIGSDDRNACLTHQNRQLSAMMDFMLQESDTVFR